MERTIFHIAMIGLENTTMDIVETYLSNWPCSLSSYDVWPNESPTNFPWTHILCGLDSFEPKKTKEFTKHIPVIVVMRREERNKIDESLRTKIEGTIFIPFEAQDLFMVLNQNNFEITNAPISSQEKSHQTDNTTAYDELERKIPNNQYLRVDQEKIDTVLNLIGELVVTKSQLLENETVLSNTDQGLNSVVSLLDKTIRDLQDKSLSLRMTPLRPVFLKLQRMSRDLALQLGKPIDFEMQGTETEIDRLLIDAISDPLLHLCRNAIDHGIETSDKRVASGKPKKGKIKIAAVQHASHINVTISDDGAGLSTHSILSKALESKIIKEEDAHNLNENQINELIFQTGFTTSQVQNDISGRGVGLSVVKSQIENIHGEVSLVSLPGKGTTFHLKLPLTTAITEGFLVKISENICVMPLNRVLEFLEMSQGSVIKTHQNNEVIKLRESYIPLYRLNLFFRKKETKKMNPQAIAVIVDCDDSRCAILVDDVLGQSQIVAKALGKTLETSHFAAGSAILGNGRIALILDIPGIVASLKFNRKADHAA